METMYDRLGDLLNETLEAGHVRFVKPPVENKEDENSKPQKSKDTGTIEKEKHERNFSTERRKNPGHKKMASAEPVPFLKKLTPEIMRAYRNLGITVSATKDEVKKAYKERLKYFHPDKHTGNAILEKIATDKTRQVVESFELIMNYLGEK